MIQLVFFCTWKPSKTSGRRGSFNFSDVRCNRQVKARLPNYHYHYGYQNHDEIPTIKWTTPNIHKETHRIAQDICERYLISGRISFTVDNVETLFDRGY